VGRAAASVDELPFFSRGGGGDGMDTFGGVRATNGVPSDSAAVRVIVKTENAKAPATWVVATAAPRHATGYHNLALIWRIKK